MAVQVVLNEKLQDVRRLEAQRNELNAKGGLIPYLFPPPPHRLLCSFIYFLTASPNAVHE